MGLAAQDATPAMPALVAAWPQATSFPDAAVAPREALRATRAATDEPAPAWLDRGRIPCLDGLRAISITLVFIEHVCAAGGYIGTGGAGKALGNIGVLGVDVFFTISGFLITLLLVREWDRNNTVSLKGFYTRRFLRLMPAMAVFLLAVAVLQWFGHGNATHANWAHLLTYTVNFDPHVRSAGHLWSLSIEEQFYFVWPLLILILAPRGGRAVAILWLLAAPVVRFVVFRFHPHDMGRFDNWTPFRVDTIAAGCLLGLLASDPAFRRLTRVSARRAAALVAAAVLVMIAAYLVGFRVSIFQVTVGHSVRAVCIAAVIWLTINNTGTAWARLLDTKVFVAVGVLSYSLYVWHQPFFAPGADVERFGLPLRLVCAIAAAVASYFLVERPFLRLKDRVGR